MSLLLFALVIPVIQAVTVLECYWPPGGCNEKIVKAGQVPDKSTWSLHPVRVLFSTGKCNITFHHIPVLFHFLF